MAGHMKAEEDLGIYGVPFGPDVASAAAAAAGATPAVGINPAVKSKRVRVAKACDQCWKLHRRCFGPDESGKCLRCDRLGKECTWDQEQGRFTKQSGIIAPKVVEESSEAHTDHSPPARPAKRRRKATAKRKAKNMKEEEGAEPNRAHNSEVLDGMLGIKGLSLARETEQPSKLHPPNGDQLPMPQCDAGFLEGCVSLTQRYDALIIAFPMLPGGFEAPREATRIVDMGLARLVCPSGYDLQLVQRDPLGFLSSFVHGLRVAAAPTADPATYSPFTNSHVALPLDQNTGLPPSYFTLPLDPTLAPTPSAQTLHDLMHDDAWRHGFAG